MAPPNASVNGNGVQRCNISITAIRYCKRSWSLACSDSWVIRGWPKMRPSRLKLTKTVMSIGLARDRGGGFQQPTSLTTTSLMVSSCWASARPGATHADNSNSDAANQETGLLRRFTAAHLMSDATCIFTILSGSVTAPLDDPGGAFFSLSTTSMPCTTSPITVY